MEDESTRREKMIALLRKRACSASELAEEFGSTPETVIDEIWHVSKSVESTDDKFLVMPPECRDCGFNGFDDLVNLPTRCPSCKSESIEEPVFKIE